MTRADFIPFREPRSWQYAYSQAQHEGCDYPSPIPARTTGGLVRSTLQAVAEKHGFIIADLTGPSRRSPLCAARFEAMWRLRRLGLSLSRIGTVLNRDHTSVLHGIRRHLARNRPEGLNPAGEAASRVLADLEARRNG